MKNKLLLAARADSIPEGWSNLWFVKKQGFENDVSSIRNNQPIILPAGEYTYLYRVTDSTLHQAIPGEVVMEDSPFELNTHLDFLLKAYGDVLVTGLGLGCVIRGLLANLNVCSVTCIEKSNDVLQLVQPYMPGERLTIIQADALDWTKHNSQSFDCAWHDLWTNKDEGEPHLDFWHAKIMLNCLPYVKMQGAWGLSRTVKRSMQRKGLKII